MTRTIRCVIVDDEPAARGAVRSLLADEPDVEIMAELADGGTALDFIRKKKPDLVFLDIQMPEMDGFTLLHRLEPGEIPAIVFVTAFDQYAVKAFEAEAMDYLLKPYSDERFHHALSRARHHIQHGRSEELADQIQRILDRTGLPAPGRYLTRLMIRKEGKITVLPLQDVEWIEADGDIVQVHSGKTTYQVRETMRELTAQLDARRFVRIHRSVIVRVDQIRELEPWFKGDFIVILQDGTRLKLSRRFKAQLEATLRSEE